MAHQTRTGNTRGRKAPPGRGRQAERLEFVQDYIPIKDLRNGIVETTDGRYLKILEIEPINFLLRSNEEQWGIISTFASWLKISPMRLQFKSVTRKADSDRYVAGLEADIEKEDVAACRELGEGTIRFIQEEGSREALTRRFFLIFQYEAVRRQSDTDYGEVYAALQTVTQNARTYFAQCGNSIVQPKDEDAFVAEILYMYFNRRSCVEDPFQSRLNRVVVDAMTAKKRVVGVDPVPKIRAVNFVAPRGLDLSHPGYIVMDGMYYTYLYIRKSGFPQQVRGGWMSSLINAGEGVDVDLHLRREIRGKTIDRVAQRIRLNRTKLRELQDTSTDYGRSILNNSKTKIILNLEPDEAEYVKDVLKLTRTEIRSITQFERGEALISSNSNKVPVIIKASREEQQMITTDRAELEAMLNELKAVADTAEAAAVPDGEAAEDSRGQALS